ncbi:MAG: hypothetical protein ABMA64_28845 [Myxococcota bacterium]
MDDPDEAFRKLAQVAEALGVARRWEASGRAWIEAARIAIDAGGLPQARAALDQAGEAFRRDDRPVEAVRAAEMAIGLEREAGTAEQAQLAVVRLAGVFGELGRAAEGVTRLGPATDAMSIDTRIGLLWQCGRKDRIRAEVEALTRAPNAGLAVAFRRAQLARMDGDLDQAERWATVVIDQLGHRPGAESGVAAARTEIAEVELLRGRPQPAIDAYERGWELHLAAGRRSLALRAEAGRVRAAVEAGLDVLPARVEEGLGFARDRGLVVLAIDLQIALGAALADRQPTRAVEVLEVAIASADRLGSRLQAGRARLMLGSRIEGRAAQRRRWLARAAADLEDHVPLRQRASAAYQALGAAEG